MEVAPGIYSLSTRKGGYVHAYLLAYDHELALIDTLYDADATIILDQIGRMGRQVRDLRHIILTHAHRSHLGGLARLKDLSGATVYAHEWEADIISGDRKAQTVSLFPQPPLRVYPLQAGLALGLGKHRPAQVDELIHDGDRIGPLQVIFTPGHSPGHLAFYWEALRLLVAGDTIATWPRFELGWRGFTLNPRQARQSLRRLAELDTEILCVGHGDPLATGAGARLRTALTASAA